MSVLASKPMIYLICSLRGPIERWKMEGRKNRRLF